MLNLEAKALAAKEAANGVYGGGAHIQNLYKCMLEIAHDTLMEYWNICFSDIKSKYIKRPLRWEKLPINKIFNILDEMPRPKSFLKEKINHPDIEWDSLLASLDIKYGNYQNIMDDVLLKIRSEHNNYYYEAKQKIFSLKTSRISMWISVFFGSCTVAPHALKIIEALKSWV